MSLTEQRPHQDEVPFERGAIDDIGERWQLRGGSVRRGDEDSAVARSRASGSGTEVNSRYCTFGTGWGSSVISTFTRPRPGSPSSHHAAWNGVSDTGASSERRNGAMRLAQPFDRGSPMFHRLVHVDVHRERGRGEVVVP